MADTKLGTTGLAIHEDKFPGIYRGKVLDNNDPLQYGRIKIQVYPMFTDITNATLLPWAVPASSLWDGAGDGIGSFVVPKVDTFVFVFFEQGDHYQPVYFAEAQTAQKGLPIDRATNYPNRKVKESSSGITFVTDDTAKTTEVHTAGGIIAKIDDTLNTVKVTHPTGTYVLIDATGKVTIFSLSDALVQAAVKIDVIAPIINIIGSTAVNINPV